MKDCIKWYVTANTSQISLDTGLIIAQSCLELIFNWWIVDQQGILEPGSDVDKMSAANKIRLVISQSNVTFEIPEEFHSLRTLMKFNNGSIKDGPSALVAVRNSLVHSNRNNRKKRLEISNEAKYQGIQLSLWYIELSLLNILGYKFKYSNRTTTSEISEYVPWIKIDKDY